MKQWSVQHHTAAMVELSKQCGFSQRFQRCDAPGCNTVVLWGPKWHQEVSVKESKPQGCPRSAHTPDNLQHIRRHIAEYMQVSLAAISCTSLT